MSKKVIVTGGAGFIGSHTVAELATAGFKPLVVDNFSNSNENMISQISKIIGYTVPYEKVDLSNAAATDRFFSHQSDALAVIHFAAYKSVPESLEHPNAYYKNNIESLLNVIAGMEKYTIKHLVFSSSCTVYGEVEQLPVTEETRFGKAITPYGHSKQLGEMIIQNASTLKTAKIKSIALRYFNPIGAHDSGWIGELPNGVPNNLMPYITQTAAGKRAQLSVYGDDYPTHDGTAIRDYIHVTDLASAHVAAMDYMMSDKMDTNYDVFNIGTGNGSSVMEVIQSFEKTNDLKLNYKIVDRRAGDIATIYAETTKANDKLQWRSKYTLDDMTRSAWLWEQNLKAKSL